MKREWEKPETNKQKSTVLHRANSVLKWDEACERVSERLKSETNVHWAYRKHRYWTFLGELSIDAHKKWMQTIPERNQSAFLCIFVFDDRVWHLSIQTYSHIIHKYTIWHGQMSQYIYLYIELTQSFYGDNSSSSLNTQYNTPSTSEYRMRFNF